MRSYSYIIAAAIAIGVGVVTLLGYFFTGPEILLLRLLFTDWAIILGALAVFLGLVNLVIVHARRVDAGGRGWVYSLLTLVATILTLGFGIGASVIRQQVVLYDSTSFFNAVFFNGIIVASQAALASLVMFFLVAAAVRMLRTKPSGWSVFFLLIVVISLVAWIPLQVLGFANTFRNWLIEVPAAAGARGILLGVALGTIAIGLRVLTGVERPYQD
jgi:hypothetical protein